jgi:hypothetical protein
LVGCHTFNEPKNWLRGINSASLCSLAGRYDNPIPTRFLAPIDCSKILAQYTLEYVARPLEMFETIVFTQLWSKNNVILRAFTPITPEVTDFVSFSPFWETHEFFLKTCDILYLVFFKMRRTPRVIRQIDLPCDLKSWTLTAWLKQHKLISISMKILKRKEHFFRMESGSLER